MKVHLSSFASGTLFALGLGVAGMTRPSKVVGFLDVAGHWDPSLAFVMIGAIVVHVVATRLILRRDGPIFGASFTLPSRRDIDLRLIVGAAIFGVGWGIGGVCPGPALTSLGAASSTTPLLFVAMMALGMRLAPKRSPARDRSLSA